MTQSAGKFYGKVDELEEAIYSETRRKTRKRLSIIGISTLILIAIIVIAVVATNHGSSEDNPNPNTSSESLSKSIKAICDATLYPSSCLSTLSPMINSTTALLDPTKLFLFSVKAAMSEISKASKALEELAQKVAVDKMSLAAFKACNELIDLAIEHLNDSLSTPDISSGDVVDDLKTWLSGSITDQQTCIDGFSNSNVELKTSVLNTMKNSTELTSNSLAILSEISNFIGSIKLRRLMSNSEDTDWSPSWLSSNDRRLLQSSTDPRKKADIVVAKDRSSKYKTIKAALKAVPEKSKKRFIIYIKKGLYIENVNIETNKWNLFMVGDGKNATIVSGSLNFIDGTSTFQSATFGEYKI